MQVGIFYCSFIFVIVASIIVIAIRNSINCAALVCTVYIYYVWREEQTIDTMGVASGLGEAFIQQK